MKKIEVLEKLDEVKKEFFDNISGLNLDTDMLDFFKLRFSYIEREIEDKEYCLSCYNDIKALLFFESFRNQYKGIMVFDLVEPLFDFLIDNIQGGDR